MMQILESLLQDLMEVCYPINEEIIKRSNKYLVVPKPKMHKGRKVYKKTKDGKLWTLGRYDTKEEAKKRLAQVERIKRMKGIA